MKGLEETHTTPNPGIVLIPSSQIGYSQDSMATGENTQKCPVSVVGNNQV